MGSRGFAALVLIALVRGYRLVVSPWLGSACRFQPSCSQYAVAVLEQDGALRGTRRSLRRISRCHPLGGGGVDLP